MIIQLFCKGQLSLHVECTVLGNMGGARNLRSREIREIKTHVYGKRQLSDHVII